MEKRKYDKRNKRSFILILVLSIAIICVFSLFIYRYIKSSKLEYKVAAGTIIQDTSKNYVSLSDDAIMKVRWNGNYYLKYNDEVMNFSDKVITYNTIDGSMKLYGTFYEIMEDAKVVEHNNETSLSNTTDAKFYKLDDREYLLVDSKIFNEDRKIEANNYLLVELDRSGNAKLSNNDLNLKTVAPTTLLTSKYSFDINNEILLYGKKEINLKKIIGSTNEYEEKEEEIPNNGNGNTGANENVNGNGTGTGIGEGGAGNVINNTDNGNVQDIGEIMDKIKMTSIIKYVEGLNQIDIDYVIYDPYNEYKSVYVEVIGNGKIETFYLNRNDTHITINNLAVNTEYKLNFIYTINDSESGELIQNTFDTYEFRTLMPEYSISVSKISMVNNRLTYRVNLDERYSVNSVNVSLEFDNKTIDLDTGDTNISKIKLEDTVSVSERDKYVLGSFDISKYSVDSDTILRLTVNSVKSGESTLNLKDAYSSFRFGR